MKKNRKLLSMLVALSISASAFAGFAIPAGAAAPGENTDGEIVLFDDPAATEEPSEATEAPTEAPAATEEPSEATEAPTEAPAQEPSVSGNDNDIDINETFDSDPADGENYTWNVTTVADWGGTNKGFSLTANTGKTILKFADGVAGPSKDLKVTFGAGTVKGFGQDAATWAIVFKSTDNTELFRLKLVSGGWARTLSLVAGGETKATNYTYSDSAYTNSEVYISFGSSGGKVTVGNQSAGFASGSNVGSIAVEYDGVKDWDRPFIVDNLSLRTVDKEKTTFTISSDSSEGVVEGAEIKIGDDTYKAGEDGKIEAYYLPGTYDYSVKLAKHSAKEGSIKIVPEGTTEKLYTFSDIPSDVTEPVLVHAYYKADKTLDNVTTEKITPVNGTYSVKAADKADCTEAYYLWDSLEGMKPISTAAASEVEITNDIDIVLEYVGDPKPTKIVISGGEEYIYLPAAGEENVTSKAFTATVYDQSDLVMEDAAVEWTLPGQPNTISIENGVVTLTPDYVLTDDNGVDITIRAAVTGTDPAVTADTSIHIHNTARPTSWDVVGPAAVKDGTQAEYTVENIKDQYKNDYTGDTPEFALTSTDANAVIEGLKITPNTGTSRTEEIKITVALADDETKSVDRTVTAYGYDFYEPGIDALSTTASNARFETINDQSTLVWPATVASTGSTVITLPEAVELTEGSAKMITFDNVWTTQTVGSQERSLTLKNSAGTVVLAIDFAGASVVKGVTKTDGNFTGDELGKLEAAGVKSSAAFILKTDTAGITTAVLSYNGGTAQTYELNPAVDGVVTPLEDIASITLTGGAGAPNERLLSLSNIIISDSDIAEVEISGDSTIAKISGLTATKAFRGSVFSQSEGETFTWSVAGEDGSTVSGVSIDQKGVLSVEDTVAADTKVIISYTSSLSTTEAPKLAAHEVTIKDFANIESADLTGPVAVNAGETVTYKVENVVDEYGDKVTMPVTFEITDGKDTIASINASTGVVTTTGTLGSYTVKATIGNPGKTTEKTLAATVSKYAEAGTTNESSVVVDVSTLANYAADTKYLVTTATADGTLVKQTDNVAHTDGKVTVDMTGAAKYEVSPIYSYSNVGNVAGGKEIPISDGRYQFTFVKANMTRGDIYVNGLMVGNNVDQDGKGTQQASSSPAWTVDDVLVQGGKAVVTMKDNTSEMSSIEVRKNPSILNRKTHLYILGDSLVADYHKTFDYSTGNIPAAGDAQTGWGQVLDQFISDELNVTNLAESGNYARGLYSPAFTSALASAESGDYIIIECGYNDSNYSSASEMVTYLERMADECAEKGVTIIMSGPNFGPLRSDTNSSSAKFTSDVLKAASEKGVLGINLSAAGSALYTSKGWTSDYWGRNFNVYYSEAVQDNLHLSYHGAMLHASLIAQAISDAQNDTENAELAASLAGLKLDKTAKTLTDSEGETLTFQVK